VSLTILSTNEGTKSQEFIDKIGANPMVFAASYLSDGRVLVWAEYVGAKGLDELGRFLRSIDGVTDVDIHTLIFEKGERCDFSLNELKVLRCLRKDARMPISEIARQSRLTPKRVRIILRKFLGDGGSVSESFTPSASRRDVRTLHASVHFRIQWDLNASDVVCFIVRLDWNAENKSRGEIVEQLETRFPEKFWYAVASATKPTLFCAFVTDHMREAEPLVQQVSLLPDIISVEALFGYPTNYYAGTSLRDALLDEMFAKAGLL
jgi:DNA-binding Lrp family transcriptional regulator